jgi:hypothetical protein
MDEHHFAEGDVQIVIRYVLPEHVAAYSALGWKVHEGFLKGATGVLVEWDHPGELPLEPNIGIS